MITNFEEITKDLTLDEKKILPILINGFKSRTKEKPIKAPEICKAINNRLSEHGLKRKFSEVKLRKMTNLIRTNAILPLIATSDGYYVSYDQNEIRNQIKSLNERAQAILSSANGLQIFLKQS